MNTFAFLYGLFLPFTSVFALSGVLNLPIVIGLVAFILILINGRFTIGKYDVAIFVLFSLPALVSFFLVADFNDKAVNHTLSYLTVYLLFYFTAKVLIVNTPIAVFKGVLCGLICSILFEYIEFFVANTVGPDALDSVPRFSEWHYEATSTGSIVRGRSFVEESGHFALYLGIIAPIVISLIRNRSKQYIVACLSVIGLLLTFSASGITITILSLFFVSFSLKPKLFLKYNLIVIGLIFLVFVLSILLDAPLFTPLIEKIGSNSFDDRYDNFFASFDLFLNSGILTWFFGFGPGYYDALNLPPVISLVALTLFQAGFLGLIFYLAMFIFLLDLVLANKATTKPYALFSLIYAFLFYFGVSNYWYPWLWFIIAYIVGSTQFVKHNLIESI